MTFVSNKPARRWMLEADEENTDLKSICETNTQNGRHVPNMSTAVDRFIKNYIYSHLHIFFWL